MDHAVVAVGEADSVALDHIVAELVAILGLNALGTVSLDIVVVLSVGVLQEDLELLLGLDLHDTGPDHIDAHRGHIIVIGHGHDGGVGVARRIRRNDADLVAGHAGRQRDRAFKGAVACHAHRHAVGLHSAAGLGHAADRHAAEADAGVARARDQDHRLDGVDGDVDDRHGHVARRLVLGVELHGIFAVVGQAGELESAVLVHRAEPVFADVGLDLGRHVGREDQLRLGHTRAERSAGGRDGLAALVLILLEAHRAGLGADAGEADQLRLRQQSDGALRRLCIVEVFIARALMHREDLCGVAVSGLQAGVGEGRFRRSLAAGDGPAADARGIVVLRQLGGVDQQTVVVGIEIAVCIVEVDAIVLDRVAVARRGRREAHVKVAVACAGQRGAGHGRGRQRIGDLDGVCAGLRVKGRLALERGADVVVSGLHQRADVLQAVHGVEPRLFLAHAVAADIRDVELLLDLAGHHRDALKDQDAGLLVLVDHQGDGIAGDIRLHGAVRVLEVDDVALFVPRLDLLRNAVDRFLRQVQVDGVALVRVRDRDVRRVGRAGAGQRDAVHAGCDRRAQKLGLDALGGLQCEGGGAGPGAVMLHHHIDQMAVDAVGGDELLLESGVAVDRGAHVADLNIVFRIAVRLVKRQHIPQLRRGFFLAVVLDLDQRVAVSAHTAHRDLVRLALVADLDAADADVVLAVVHKAELVVDGVVLNGVDRVFIDPGGRFGAHAGADRDQDRLFLRALHKQIGVGVRQALSAGAEFNAAAPVVCDADGDGDRSDAHGGAAPDLVVIQTEGHLAELHAAHDGDTVRDLQRGADEAFKVDPILLNVLADEEPRLADDDVQAENVHLHRGGDEPRGHPLGLDLRLRDHGLALVSQHAVELNASHLEDHVDAAVEHGGLHAELDADAGLDDQRYRAGAAGDGVRQLLDGAADLRQVKACVDQDAGCGRLGLERDDVRQDAPVGHTLEG